MIKNPYDNSNNKAVKPRSIVEGQLNLLATEHKLFDIILAQINKSTDDEENTIYQIFPKDYEKMTTISNKKDFYKMLRNAGYRLMKKTMILGDKRKGRKFNLVSECAWNESTGMIEIELSKSAKKLLIAMIKDEPDTYTKLRFSLQLTGKYTHALYDMLKEFEGTGWRKDFVADLREKLNVPSSYNYGRFKKNVILESINEINEKTDIQVSFREHKKIVGGKGRKSIDRIDWEIQKKETLIATDIIEESYIDYLLDFLKDRVKIDHDEAIAIVRAAQKNGLSLIQMKNRISVILNNPNIKNFVGFCIWAMGNNFKSPAQVKQQFHNFNQRNYDYEELERILLSGKET